MKLIHISDIHIHSDPILEADPVANFNACLSHVGKHHGDADLLVITGDLTHHGRRASYEVLRDILNRHNMSPLLMIGNHDNRDTFQTVFPQTPQDGNGFVQYVVDRPEGLFIFLDTVQHGTHAGHFCEARQDWMKSRLAAAAEQQRRVYLFMHHNPVDTGVLNADKIGLVDGEAFREILTTYRETIRHIFFGHCHYILSGSVCGIPMSAPRSTNHPCAPDFSGIDRMGYGPFQPTYDVCLLNEEAVVVHSIDFLEDDKIRWLETDSSGWVKKDTIEND